MWTAFASTAVTSSVFLTALAPNLLARRLIAEATSINISWTQWLLGVLPVGLVLLVPLPLLVYLVYPPEIRSSPEVPSWAAGELRGLGRLSPGEWQMGVLIGLAIFLWIFGGEWIDPTTVILVVVSLMLVTRIIAWEEVIGHRAAWDTLCYFGTLLALADGLSRVGVVKWAAGLVTDLLAGYPPLAVVVVLVVFFFLVHYLFASLTAHTTAVLPALLAAGVAFPGVPIRLLVFLLAYSIGLMGVISPYATGPAPVYYGCGFISRREFWWLGLLFGLIYLAALLCVGLPFLSWMEGPGAMPPR
jgi:L-tartrate/succinate antiporter